MFLLELFVYAATCYWVALALLILFTRSEEHWATHWSAELDKTLPSVSLIFAARDEERNIAAAVRSMLELGQPVSEIIAVDDRSKDQTTAILRDLAQQHPRLKVMRVEHLPDGWLGKTHALQVGFAAASGDWILFTDADVSFEASVVRRALQAAQARQAQHVIGFPEMRSQGFGERCMLAVFYMAFAMRSPAFFVERLGRHFFMGVGAFNLVRRDALQKLDGLRHLKLSIDEDMRLGEALKVHGYQPAMLYLAGFSSVEWQVGLKGTIKGLEKNVFANLGFSIVATLAATLGMLAMFHSGLLALALGLYLPAILTLFSAVYVMRVAQRQSGLGPIYAFAFPLGAWFLAAAMVNSMVATLRRGGVIWRDSFYPTAVLKAHIRERHSWLQTVQRERSRRS